MSTVLLENQPLPVPTDPVHTPEELLQKPDGPRFELIDGQLVERNMGAVSSEIANKVNRFIGNHVYAAKLGKSFGADCGYRIFPDQPSRVRYPDGSFIARGRFPGDRVPRGHIRIFPDLALEVVSPNDMAEEIETKRLEFLRAGTRLLWILYPETRTVHVYRQSGQTSVLGAADELTGEDVLPGFSCRVAELFESD